MTVPEIIGSLSELFTLWEISSHALDSDWPLLSIIPAMPRGLAPEINFVTARNTLKRGEAIET